MLRSNWVTYQALPTMPPEDLNGIFPDCLTIFLPLTMDIMAAERNVGQGPVSW